MGPPLFAVAIACWLVPMLLVVAAKDDPALNAYRDDILFRQTVTRYRSGWDHQEGPWYYFAHAPALWMPATLLLPWLLPAWWRRVAELPCAAIARIRGRWRRLHRDAGDRTSPPARHQDRAADMRQVVLLGWALLVFAFFTAASGKRGVYILPMLPALALAAAPLLPGIVRRRAVRRLLLGTCWALCALLALVAVVELVAPQLPAQLADVPELDAGAVGTALLATAVLAAGWLWWRRARPLVAGAGVLVLLWSAAGWVGMPLVNRQVGLERWLGEIDAGLGPDAQLGIVRFREQYALAAPRGITSFGYRAPNPEQLDRGLAWLAERPGRWLLIPIKMADDAPDRLDHARIRAVGCPRGDCWVLAGQDALLPRKP